MLNDFSIFPLWRRCTEPVEAEDGELLIWKLNEESKRIRVSPFGGGGGRTLLVQTKDYMLQLSNYITNIIKNFSF